MTVSELGIYSSVFIDTATDRLDDKENFILENHTMGRLMRTKCSKNDEGGINTGFSVIDQPYLVDI